MGLGIRVGVLGGTFDPIHYGHLAAAEEARVRLQLHPVLFVPAGRPPHKPNRAISPTHHRLAMVELAIGSNPHFRLSRVDVDRGGVCYSVDTVRLLQEELGPTAEIYFIVGLDSLADIHQWHEPQQLVQLCRVVAMTRPGYEQLDMSNILRLVPEAAGRIQVMEMPRLEISSSELRRRVAVGLPIKYQVPEAVEEYIRQHGLYGEGR